ncbi:phorbol-12-myristate-13-acetate-induced protein 1 [Kryptolebias marmoratus]|nr:phorbol-12-myristate-13-acetate-induced protein 1 [Kryptolebias marmoratus]
MASQDIDFTAVVELCARELRLVGDQLYWRYKLLEILVNNYKTVYKVT